MLDFVSVKRYTIFFLFKTLLNFKTIIAKTFLICLMFLYAIILFF